LQFKLLIILLFRKIYIIIERERRRERERERDLYYTIYVYFPKYGNLVVLGLIVDSSSERPIYGILVSIQRILIILKKRFSYPVKPELSKSKKSFCFYLGKVVYLY